MSRKPFVPAALLGKLWRCIIEFEMLKEGDRVLIGLSGGNADWLKRRQRQYVFNGRAGRSAAVCAL